MKTKMKKITATRIQIAPAPAPLEDTGTTKVHPDIAKVFGLSLPFNTSHFNMDVIPAPAASYMRCNLPRASCASSVVGLGLLLLGMQTEKWWTGSVRIESGCPFTASRSLNTTAIFQAGLGLRSCYAAVSRTLATACHPSNFPCRNKWLRECSSTLKTSR